MDEPCPRFPPSDEIGSKQTGLLTNIDESDIAESQANNENPK